MKLVKLALAASMSANNVTTDPRSIAVVSVFYHIVDFGSDEALLVSWQPSMHHAAHLACSEPCCNHDVSDGLCCATLLRLETGSHRTM